MATQTNPDGFTYDPVTGTPVDKPTADNAAARWRQIDAKATSAESGSAAALATLGAVKQEATAAKTAAQQSASSAIAAQNAATDAEDTADRFGDDVELLKQMAEISPGSVTDAQTALLIQDPESETRARLKAQTGELLSAAVKVTEVAGLPSRPSIQIGGLINGSAIEPTAINSVMLQPGSPGYNNIIGGDGTATVGTATPNTVSPEANNVSVAMVGGYDNVVGSIADKIISDHAYTEMGGAGHNIIMGGAYGIIRATAKHAGIYGGERNEVGGSWGFATGDRNKVMGQASAATGRQNTLTNQSLGSTADGAENTVNGSYSRASGNLNDVQGSFSTADGQQGAARGPWEQVYAAGQFAKKGDAQAVRTIMRKQTTTATLTILGKGGTSLGPLLPPNTAVTFTMQVLAVEPATGTAKAWRVEGTTKRGSTGGLAHVGTPTITVNGADAAAAAWTIAIPAGGSGYLTIQGQGEAGKTINWICNCEYSELGY